VRSTSNPAFRNLPTGGYGNYAGFNSPPLAAGGSDTVDYGGYPAAPVDTERPITIDDVVTKTVLTLGTLVLAGVATGLASAQGIINPLSVLLPAVLVGLVLALVVIFRRKPSAPLVLLYAAAQGVALGAITFVFEGMVAGIALQAVIGTVGVFAGMLITYRTGAIRVTPRLTKWIIGATIGAVVLMLANLVAGLFGANLGLRDGGTLAIIFSIVVIGIAAFNLLLDFDQADRMIRDGLPAKFAWYAAFGLTVTLVWLYLEILRLLYYLQSE
jgi:uncharacterized YccA/Bax inhibitor family protein